MADGTLRYIRPEIIAIMSAPEIHAKLEAFLARHPSPTEECHVVYLLVELRKIMDQLWARPGFSLVRFYADWSVHSQKDRVTPDIAQIAEGIYGEVAANPAAGVQMATAFSHMAGLQEELADMFEAIGVNSTLATDAEIWGAFVSLLTAVLADQPIINPSPRVREIRFEPHSRECVITFSQPAGGSSSHRQARPR